MKVVYCSTCSHHDLTCSLQYVCVQLRIVKTGQVKEKRPTAVCRPAGSCQRSGTTERFATPKGTICYFASWRILLFVFSTRL